MAKMLDWAFSPKFCAFLRSCSQVAFLPFVPPTSAHIRAFGHEWSWYLVPVSKRALRAPTPELVMHPCSHRPTSVGVLFQSVAKQGSGIRLRFNARVRGGRSVPLVGASRYYSFAAFGGGRAPAAVRRAAAGAHRLRCVAGSPALSCRCAPRRRALHPRPPHLRRGVGARRGCGLRPNAAAPRPPAPVRALFVPQALSLVLSCRFAALCAVRAQLGFLARLVISPCPAGAPFGSTAFPPRALMGRACGRAGFRW